MSANLIEKLKKSRETQVTVDGFTFTVRRPTDMEFVDMRNMTLKQGDFLERFVIDWQRVGEIDIIPGGTTVAVPFSTDLFMEWIADRPKLWAPLIEAIISSYNTHQKSQGDALGKPEPG